MDNKYWLEHHFEEREMDRAERIHFIGMVIMAIAFTAAILYAIVN
jgi:hypothetical protein